jgi:hypothetical protein
MGLLPKSDRKHPRQAFPRTTGPPVVPHNRKGLFITLLANTILSIAALNAAQIGYNIAERDVPPAQRPNFYTVLNNPSYTPLIVWVFTFLGVELIGFRFIPRSNYPHPRSGLFGDVKNDISQILGEPLKSAQPPEEPSESVNSQPGPDPEPEPEPASVVSDDEDNDEDDPTTYLMNYGPLWTKTS